MRPCTEHGTPWETEWSTSVGLQWGAFFAAADSLSRLSAKLGCSSVLRSPKPSRVLDDRYVLCKPRIVNGLRTLGGPLVVAAIVAIVYSCLPLGTAVEFGGDEGFELMKGLLCSKGYKLYSEIWSDQPPVLSLLLASSFKHWGADIRVARLMAAGFGLLLFASFYRLVNWRSGAWAAFPAVFLLVPAPGVLELSVSVMQEVPAFATALVAVWLLFHWRDRRHWGWLLASGAAFGLALEIKLTAGLIVPAIAMEIFLSHFSHRTTSWKQSGSCLLYWGTAGVAAFAVIGLIWGGGSFQSAWRAHATARDVQGLERPWAWRSRGWRLPLENVAGGSWHFPSRFCSQRWLFMSSTALGGLIIIFTSRFRWRGSPDLR